MAGTIEELVARYDTARVERQLQALESHGETIDDPDLWLRVAVAHDFKFMPIEEVERCPCGSESSRHLSRFIYWNLLGTRQCESCGLVYVSPRLTQTAMNRVFNEFYFSYSDQEHWDERRVPVFEDVTRLLRRCECRTVLDMGTAYGRFVRWAVDEGFEASGCDISRKAVEWGRRNLGVTLHVGAVSELDLPRGSLDCVTCLDTLYYVPDPQDVLRAIHVLIKPGGHLILRLRNNLLAATRARIEGRKPVGRVILPLPHLWGFTPETIGNLLERCGFEIVRVEAAAYSRTRLGPVTDAAVAASRTLTNIFGLPPLTHSFNIVAQTATASR